LGGGLAGNPTLRKEWEIKITIVQPKKKIFGDRFWAFVESLIGDVRRKQIEQGGTRSTRGTSSPVTVQNLLFVMQKNKKVSTVQSEIVRKKKVSRGAILGGGASKRQD